MQAPPALSGYERLGGAVPVIHAPALRERARELSRLLEEGSRILSETLDEEPPGLEAALVASADWESAPRENSRPYPLGLPYFTRSTRPPTLVLPAELSGGIQPCTPATFPLAVWHELAHAFLLKNKLVRAPVWLSELAPQAASVVIARRTGAPLEEHVSKIGRKPGLKIREFREGADAGTQMAFQNLLLALAAEAVSEFGEGFAGRLVRALRAEKEVIGKGRAETLFAESLGPRGREWLSKRSEF